MNRRYFVWILFSLFCFSASLGKFASFTLPEPPPLVFPLQQVRDFGRPLTLTFLGLLGVYTYKCKSKSSLSLIQIPLAFRYLWCVHVIIFLKNFLYGDIEFSLIVLGTYTAFLWVLSKGVMKWLHQDGFTLANQSLAAVGTIFCVLNLYQALQNSYPVTFINGQFSGTTNNPQMAALTLVSTIPCLIFQFEKQSPTWRSKVLNALALFFALYFIWWTASRTGLIMAVATILFFYRFRQGALVKTTLAIGSLIAISVLLFGIDTSTLFSNAAEGFTLTSKLQSGGNTRSAVWLTLWNIFLENPLFGAPLQGDRIGFGENSWLAVAATTGVIGLIPLLLFGAECVKMIAKMLTLSRRHPHYYFHCSVVISGISGLLVGSMAEAFLVGILSTPITALLTFLLMGNYLLQEAAYLENRRIAFSTLNTELISNSN